VVDMGHDGEIADFGEIGHAAGVLAPAGAAANGELSAKQLR
jgi:hypothetical protein